MNIHIISDDIQRFEDLRENWQAVYSADPNTTVFLSWAWLRGWIAATPYKWIVLAAQTMPGSPYVAFMIVGMHHAEIDGRPQVILYMGGNPFSYHTGFICLPEHAEKALPALATFIKNNLHWHIFHLKEVTDPRLDLFLKCFGRMKFQIREYDKTPWVYIPLPATVEHYMEKVLGSKTRQELKRRTRLIENLNGFHISHLDGDSIHSGIETLLGLWQEQWGKQPEETLNMFRSLFMYCFKNDLLVSRILWDGNVPIAGSISFIDRQKKYKVASLNVFNGSYHKLSPGSVMCLLSIKYAIEQGLGVFDLGVHNKTYKYSFGGHEGLNRNIMISNIGYMSNLRRQLKIRTRIRNLLGVLKDKG